ncbi:enoyl-CoA hydratase [Amycolatopsis acidicola]|uniref:Enoyl-CoA hydratase n=1 Tax=Amycolatopsis acidicola TaxID=2596893 RepID=A0A5N0VDN1_9PSEU|nr:enoyl-CoA hydratase-related protein [Amycolatopsis acidicola]KAA9164449.1 enoyl-CoA hydratase [Amycolatopsis acidicola]
MTAEGRDGWRTPPREQHPTLAEISARLKVTRCETAANGVATVWLHRPDRRNSWTARMNAEYRAILRALDADPAVRAVVVTGSGNSFCVGADSRALSGYVGTKSYDPGLPDDAAEPGYGVRDEFDADMVWHYGLRVPVIAAVNGACAGVAVALAAFSDVRFAVSGAKITAASPRLGLPSEYGLSWILPRLMGVTHAADFLLSGRVVDSDFLAKAGFFNAVFPRAEFAEAVGDYAAQLAAASPQAVTLAKRQLYTDLLQHDPALSVRRSKDLTGRMMTTDDYREGVSALVGKRAPVFGPA